MAGAGGASPSGSRRRGQTCEEQRGAAAERRAGRGAKQGADVAAAAGRGVAAAGRWPRGGRGARTASAERDRGQQVRPAFLQSPDEKETETEEERRQPGPAGAEPGPGPARGGAARPLTAPRSPAALRPGRAQGEERAAPPSSHVPGAVGQRRRSANRCPSGSLLSAAGLALCPLRWGFCCSNWSPVFREQEGREAPRGGNACVGRASLGREPRAGGGAFDINKSTADVKRGAFKQTLTSIVTRGRGHLTPYLPRGRRWVVGVR